MTLSTRPWNVERPHALVARSLALIVAVSLFASTVPAMASAALDPDADRIPPDFASSLASPPVRPAPAERMRITAPTEKTTPTETTALRTPASAVERAIVPRAARAVAPAPTTRAARVPARSEAPRTSALSAPPAVAAPAPSGDELAQAKAILSGLISRYPILSGTVVSFGETPGDYQAVSYYQSGRIVIDPDHTAGLSTILNHEVWHIIDWRDNNRIDWGESIPPRP